MSSTSSPTEPLDLARLLPRFWRGEPPEDFLIAGIAAVLSEYPSEVRRAVCSAKGLPARSKFFPAIAEVREACEGEMAPHRREAERRRKAEEMRDLLAAPADEITPEARDRVAAHWADARKAMSAEDDAAAEVAKKARLAEIKATSDRMRDRELKRNGIDDGRPIGLELRGKLQAMGARFEEATE